MHIFLPIDSVGEPDRAFSIDSPIILNSDQWSHFTNDSYLQCLLSHDILVSMYEKGRAPDSVFNKHFWRSIQYKEIYGSPRHAKK